MRTCTSFLAFITLAATLVESQNITFPAQQGPLYSDPVALNINGTNTDTAAIASTVANVDQKGGATGATPPDQPPSNTTVTAIDGTLVNATVPTRRSISSGGDGLRRRLLPGYEQVFSGNGTGPNDRDAAIQGTAYLTYSLVDNSTYSVDQCLQKCDNTKGCVFANVYYEFNNPLLDFVFSEHSNLKCVLYADVHTAAEKTNAGGQQLEPPPAGLTYVQQSSGYAATTLVDPQTPDGYQLVFGPTGGANNAPGYMGFAFIDKYDVQACANLCDSRDPDPNGGACQYFNIWRALVDGIPTTYTCSMYFIPADESTAVNTGQGNLKVTYSRGYRRVSALPDGGFEGYVCNGAGPQSAFCFTESYANWNGTSPSGGYFDASIFHYQPYAHSGNSVGLLGSAYGADSLAGTLTPANPLQTEAGKNYTIQFFHASMFSDPQSESQAFVDVMWNGQVVTTIQPGFSSWKFYNFEVMANGQDVLAFHGGKSPAFSFIDDVYVFLA